MSFDCMQQGELTYHFYAMHLEFCGFHSIGEDVLEGQVQKRCNILREEVSRVLQDEVVDLRDQRDHDSSTKQIP